MRLSLPFIFIFSLLLNFNSQCQFLRKEWAARVGGFNDETLKCMIPLPDSSVLLAGSTSSSLSGDLVTSSFGYTDYWIVDIDNTGQIKWQKRYGGNGIDNLNAIIQTADGGFLLGGYSSSNISGDKSENNRDTILNGYYGDFWIIKTDSSGNKLWDRTYGGYRSDELFSISQCNDGGYILGGTSLSDSSADKSSHSWDTQRTDYWIIKIDSSGNKEWDKDFGGVDEDDLLSVVQSHDGGYILGGYSRVTLSGDHTEPTRDTAFYTNFTSGDYWVVKTDATGNKIWDHRYGGKTRDQFSSLMECSNNDILLFGFTRSKIGGDVSTIGCYLVEYDYWLVRTDSIGVKIWDKCYGGPSAEEFAGNFFRDYDGGYLLSGTSYSGLGCQKSENNLGTEQTWAVKIDSLGNYVFDKTLQNVCNTLHEDEVGFAIGTCDSCYILANNASSFSGSYGDLPHSGVGGTDYSLVKYCPRYKFPSASLTADDYYICAGECISFHNYSNFSDHYYWELSGGTPSFSVDSNPHNICFVSPGQYMVTLHAYNHWHEDSNHIYINVSPVPIAPPINRNGDTLSVPSGYISYQWYFNGSIIPGSNDSMCLITQPGIYGIIITDSMQCESLIAYSDFVNAIVEQDYSPGIYYDHDNKFIHSAQFSNMTIYDITSNVIINENIFSQYSTNNIKPGVYIVRLINNNKNYFMKIVIF